MVYLMHRSIYTHSVCMSVLYPQPPAPTISLGIEYRVDFFSPSFYVPAYPPHLTTSRLIRSITRRGYKDGAEVLGAFCGIVLERGKDVLGGFSSRLAGKNCLTVAEEEPVHDLWDLCTQS